MSAGVSFVSYDYPFHASGPRDKKYQNLNKVVSQAIQIIKFLKRSKKPVILLGMSFGPVLIQEILEASPTIAQAAIYVSPGGAITPSMLDHYKVLERDLLQSAGLHDGLLENWLTDLEYQSRTVRIARMTTTIPIKILAGTRDLWSSPTMIEELAGRYPKGNYQIVPDQTHTGLLNAKDQNGDSVLLLALHEIMSKLSLSTEIPLKFIYDSRREIEVLNRHEPAFKIFLESLGQINTVKFQSTRASASLLSDYRKWRANQMYSIFENADSQSIVKLKDSNPRFFDAVQRRKAQALTEDGIYNWAAAILVMDSQSGGDRREGPTIQGLTVPWK